MTTQDYYQILNVSPTASRAEIKEAYRRLAFQYHPDRNISDPDTAEKMKRLNEAYAVLSNDTKRREYDGYRNRFGQRARRHFRENYTDDDIFSGSDIHAVFEEMAKAFGLRGFEEIFKDAYGPGFRTFKVHRPGFFAKGFVFFGSPGKQGHGTDLKSMPGSLGRFGKYLLKKLLPGGIPEKGADIHDVIVLNPGHAQQGGPYAYYLKQKKKKLVVKIPKGVKDGQLIRLAKQGKEGKHGGDPGDVLLKVKIKKPWGQRLKERIRKKHATG
ncbi:MAG: J domain-containing protein [Deltaproteobacteria bacterium]|nr:J domain-containing protein [Deltaproteobacteria bacterium]MBW1954576.1 J domain-containing protein [Deltaproteobacteria bacterium]MBW2040697.1 J domain-containing protein [Deltaproteobacteria bacterium]MBW2132527.1 J domain-containing protein [Deltaproteobacteria bacterium]